MHKLFLIVSALLILVACTPDEQIIETPELEAPLFFLSYDGENETAPVLPAGGFFEAAQRLTPDQWAAPGEAQVVQVYFYLLELPETASIRLYRGSNGDAPDSLVLDQALNTRLLVPESWNVIELDRAIALDNQDLWLAMRFSHAEEARSLGCDPGPAHPEGNWLYDSFDSQWTPLSQRTSGAISINWNLRAVVEPQ